jgi:hypothetical protein
MPELRVAALRCFPQWAAVLAGVRIWSRDREELEGLEEVEDDRPLHPAALEFAELALPKRRPRAKLQLK